MSAQNAFVFTDSFLCSFVLALVVFALLEVRFLQVVDLLTSLLVALEVEHSASLLLVGFCQVRTDLLSDLLDLVSILCLVFQNLFSQEL